MQKNLTLSPEIDLAKNLDTIGGEMMDKKKQEQIQEQKNQDKFNNITQKVTPENQNQTHNSKKEGIQPINQKR